jgi:hypothetical protein
MPTGRELWSSLSTVFLLFFCAFSALNVFAQNPLPRIRNIVLVHGAWADGSGWRRVYETLAKDGYNVSIMFCMHLEALTV